MAAEFISAPFRKAVNIIKKPFVTFCEKHQSGITRTVNVLNKYSLLFHAIGSVIIELFIESFSRHSAAAGIAFMVESPLVFLYNSLLIFMTLMIVYLFRRRAVLRLANRR